MTLWGANFQTEGTKHIKADPALKLHLCSIRVFNSKSKNYNELRVLRRCQFK